MSSNNEICYSTKIQTFSPTKHTCTTDIITLEINTKNEMAAPSYYALHTFFLMSSNRKTFMERWICAGKLESPNGNIPYSFISIFMCSCKLNYSEWFLKTIGHASLQKKTKADGYVEDYLSWKTLIQSIANLFRAWE